MNLNKCILIKNDCYKYGRTIVPKGIMVHSTGANNPLLRRYVQPDDGKLGVNAYNNSWNTTKPGGAEVCVHAFIGKLADGSIATYQTLPWNYRGWHAGGSANDTHISFEICEDGLADKTYFDRVYKEAVELCAYLCKQYSLNPLKDGVLICHSEGYKRGTASNHGDVMHWFPRHGKSMDTFRAAVKAEIDKQNTNNETEEEEMRYNKVADMPKWAQPTIIKMIDKGYIKGGGSDVKDKNGRPTDLDLSMDMIRIFVTNNNVGLYGQ